MRSGHFCTVFVEEPTSTYVYIVGCGAIHIVGVAMAAIVLLELFKVI